MHRSETEQIDHLHPSFQQYENLRLERLTQQRKGMQRMRDIMISYSQKVADLQQQKSKIGNKNKKLKQANIKLVQQNRLLHLEVDKLKKILQEQKMTRSQLEKRIDDLKGQVESFQGCHQLNKFQQDSYQLNSKISQRQIVGEQNIILKDQIRTLYIENSNLRALLKNARRDGQVGKIRYVNSKKNEAQKQASQSSIERVRQKEKHIDQLHLQIGQLTQINGKMRKKIEKLKLKEEEYKSHMKRFQNMKFKNYGVEQNRQRDNQNSHRAKNENQTNYSNFKQQNN